MADVQIGLLIKKDQLSLLSFKRHIATSLIQTPSLNSIHSMSSFKQTHGHSHSLQVHHYIRYTYCKLGWVVQWWVGGPVGKMLAWYVGDPGSSPGWGRLDCGMVLST